MGMGVVPALSTNGMELNGRGLTVQMVCSSFLCSAFFFLAAGNCWKLQETGGTMCAVKPLPFSAF